MEEYKYYVGGEFRSGKKIIDAVDPARAESFAKFFETDSADFDLALKKARWAASEWRKTPFKERAQGLREISKAIFDNLQTLAELETKEIGKSLKESLFVDVPLSADCFNYYAGFLDTLEEKSLESELGLDLLKYEPFGVCGVYLPYNVPLMSFGFSSAAAIAAGNAIIVKPSEYGSLSLLELAKYIDALDIPKGLISIISGGGPGIGNTLAQSEVDLISFTGSRETLKKISAASASNPKKIICELGGANITAVFSDAQREDAIQNILASSFMKQGQMCIGTSLLFVDQRIYKDFLKELVDRASRINVDDPFLPGTGIGPLVTKDHLDNLHRRINKLAAKGAKILTGAKPLDRAGYFYPPTIIEIKETIYEEFFAPVILVKSFSTEKEMENIIENNPTGLILQIWTSDLARAKALADKASCGTIWINSFAQMNSQTPFGGTRASGWGRNLGEEGFFEYVQTKHIGIGFKKSPVWGWFGV